MELERAKEVRRKWKVVEETRSQISRWMETLKSFKCLSLAFSTDQY